jgi:DNA polymerase-4
VTNDRTGPVGAFLCRDCLADSAGAPPPRCSDCGSPRLIAYPGGNLLAIAHVDCDAFYASIEKRDNPDFEGRPLIVGGGRRGVVSTCCYIARTFGVRSAMPMFQAMKLCPEAIVVAPNMAKYAAVGREIKSMMQSLTPLVESVSIDEAFLDLTGCERVHGAGAPLTLARLAKNIETEVRVTVSVGLSYCKFLAKLASDLDKPRGYSIVERSAAMALLAPLPVGRIWGVGKVAQTRLDKAGFRLIGDIQAIDEPGMLARHGVEFGRLWRLARGIDERRVSPERETKSISSETTFDVDTSDKEQLVRILLILSERVAARLKKQGLACKSVTLKMRTADFKLRTRVRSGFEPTQLATRLFLAARSLLEREMDGARFRLLGVSATEFVAAERADQGDLVDQGIGRERARERAIDSLREKFGDGAVVRGLAFKTGTPKRS